MPTTRWPRSPPTTLAPGSGSTSSSSPARSSSPCCSAPPPLDAAPHRQANEKGTEMAAIVESIEIARRPEEVFAYATDFSHFPEWQGGVSSARPESDAPLAVGSKAIVTRQAGPRKLARTEEITELNPPMCCAFFGVGAPTDVFAICLIEPLPI